MDSRIIENPRHFSNYNMTGEAMTALSWSSTMPDYKEIAECKDVPGPKQGECQNDPNRVIPYFNFMGSSASELTDANRNDAVTKVNQVVANAISKAVRHRSQVWDPSRLSDEETPTPGALNDLSFMQTDGLAKALSSYTSMYLFAKNMLLVAAYHGAQTSDCLVVLDKFSPASILDQLDAFTEPTNLDNSGQLIPAMNAVSANCLSKGVEREIYRVRAKLVSLQNSQ